VTSPAPPAADEHGPIPGLHGRILLHLPERSVRAPFGPTVYANPFCLSATVLPPGVRSPILRCGRNCDQR
jgi:hypothetical protein